VYEWATPRGPTPCLPAVYQTESKEKSGNKSRKKEKHRDRVLMWDVLAEKKDIYICATVITINQQLLAATVTADWFCYRCVLIL